MRLSALQIDLLSFAIVGVGLVLLQIVFISYFDTKMAVFALGGVGALALGVVIFARPQVGAYVLVFVIATNLSSVFTQQGLPSINKPLVGLVVVSLLAYGFLQKKNATQKFSLKAVEVFIIAYICVRFISVFAARDTDKAMEEVLDTAKDFVIILCIAYALKTPEQWQRTIWIVVIATGVVAILGAYQVFTGDYEQTFGGLLGSLKQGITDDLEQNRLGGPIGRPNFYGQILVSILCLTIYRMIDAESWWAKLAAVVAAFFIVFATFNTYSRGAFVTMALMLGIIALEPRVKISLIVTCGLVGLLLIQVLPEGYGERLQTLSVFAGGDDEDGAVVQEDLSFRGRFSEIQSGILMFGDHPFLGVGIGNYERNYQDYAGKIGLEYRAEERAAHSLYIEAIAETGMIGLLVFSGLFVTFFMGLQRAQRQIKQLPDYAYLSSWIRSIQIAVLSYLVSSIFLHGDFFRYMWLLIALGATIMHIADQLQEKTHQPALETRTL